MVFTSQPTPIGVDASWTGLAVTALELPEPYASGMACGRAWAKEAIGGKAKWRVRMSEVLSTKPGDFPSQSARLLRLGEMLTHAVESAIDFGESRFVAIEGYAMGSKTRPQMAGELGGHLRLLLWQAGVPYIIVPPTTLKKYVLGKGNAAKELMLKEVFRKWGYDTTSNDRADAYALARIAAEFAAGGWTKKFEGLAQGFEVVGVKS